MKRFVSALFLNGRVIRVTRHGLGHPAMTGKGRNARAEMGFVDFCKDKTVQIRGLHLTTAIAYEELEARLTSQQRKQ
jgi:hypothetical protein